MQVLRLTLLLTVSTLAAAQSTTPSKTPWQMQESGTTAGLRGIYSVDGTVAWASGTGGTVLKTVDGGAHWTTCAVPDAAKDGATLDFRGVQAWDATTAIVMASGKGENGRLYKTKDGCHSWQLIFTNPDEDGFFNAILRTTEGKLYVLGDPVKRTFALFQSEDLGDTWYAAGELGRDAQADEASFAASNSELASYGPYLLFGSGGSSAHVFATGVKCSPPPGNLNGPAITNCIVGFHSAEVPIVAGSPASGVFSVAARQIAAKNGVLAAIIIAVGGTYDHADNATRTAAFSTDGGNHWTASITPPHGFRSAVQWSEALKLWITVGTNGSDVSRDDGKTWQPLDDGNWNALSLPFVVGPNGRIARLNVAALR
jgi:photosystem II stability/assembly factor-like uncharacterized protein